MQKSARENVSGGSCESCCVCVGAQIVDFLRDLLVGF